MSLMKIERDGLVDHHLPHNFIALPTPSAARRSLLVWVSPTARLSWIGFLPEPRIDKPVFWCELLISFRLASGLRTPLPNPDSLVPSCCLS